MSPERVTLSPTLARRLAITRQRLAGPRPGSILGVLRDIRCLQLDPITAVARSPLLVLWSRLGQYDPAGLRHLLWDQRALFEYWAHAASIVLTADYPIFHVQMRQYAEGGWRPRTQKWLAENVPLRRHILERLEAEGPLAPGDFDHDEAVEEWHSSGWTNRRTVNQMLDCMWAEGEVLVAGRSGRTRLWDLAERCLPAWTPRQELSEREAVRRAAQIALRALGVGTARHVREHFIRKSYPGLDEVLAELQEEGRIVPARIVADGAAWPDDWFIHSEDLPLLDALQNGDWQPRTILLSPFDNLICDRQRTEQLFDFYFRLEIYTPRDQRQYGYYVLPILHGDCLIGRVDSKLERKTGTLRVNAVYAEPDAPVDVTTGRALAAAIEDLAAFIGAKTIAYPDDVPAGWRRALR